MKTYLTYCSGTKALVFKFLSYSFTLVPIIIGDFKLRKHWKPKYIQRIFWVYKNRRLATNVWDLDIVVLGIMFQFQKYKPFMLE